MPQFINDHLSEIFSFITGLISGGAGGALIALRITSHKRVGERGSLVDQSRASAGGDIVGRDKKG